MDLNISGKSAIICASSRGLGKACALALANEGVNVWISARHEEALNEAAREIADAGGGAVHAVVADVTTPARAGCFNGSLSATGYRRQQCRRPADG